MDQIDHANDLAEHEREIAIATAASAGPVAAPTGRCLNCGVRLRKDRRWCNAECREDWEARRKRP